jgi:hypothetical protein
MVDHVCEEGFEEWYAQLDLSAFEGVDKADMYRLFESGWRERGKWLVEGESGWKLIMHELPPEYTPILGAWPWGERWNIRGCQRCTCEGQADTWSETGGGCIVQPPTFWLAVGDLPSLPERPKIEDCEVAV